MASEYSMLGKPLSEEEIEGRRRKQAILSMLFGQDFAKNIDDIRSKAEAREAIRLGQDLTKDREAPVDEPLDTSDIDKPIPGFEGMKVGGRTLGGKPDSLRTAKVSPLDPTTEDGPDIGPGKIPLDKTPPEGNAALGVGLGDRSKEGGRYSLLEKRPLEGIEEEGMVGYGESPLGLSTSGETGDELKRLQEEQRAKNVVKGAVPEEGSAMLDVPEPDIFSPAQRLVEEGDEMMYKPEVDEDERYMAETQTIRDKARIGGYEPYMQGYLNDRMLEPKRKMAGQIAENIREEFPEQADYLNGIANTELDPAKIQDAVDEVQKHLQAIGKTDKSATARRLDAKGALKAEQAPKIAEFVKAMEYYRDSPIANYSETEKAEFDGLIMQAQAGGEKSFDKAIDNAVKLWRTPLIGKLKLQGTMDLQSQLAYLKSYNQQTARLRAQYDAAINDKMYDITGTEARELAEIAMMTKSLDWMIDHLRDGNMNIFKTTDVGKIIDPKAIQHLQRIREFYGRDLSGAAISRSEWANFDTQILPKLLAQDKSKIGEAIKGLQDIRMKGLDYGAKMTKDDAWLSGMRGFRPLREGEKPEGTITSANRATQTPKTDTGGAGGGGYDAVTQAKIDAFKKKAVAKRTAKGGDGVNPTDEWINSEIVKRFGKGK